MIGVCLLLLEQRQGNGKAAALAKLALNAELPAMLLGDPLGNGQAQACTRPGARVFGPVEAVKNSGQVG